MRYMVLILLFAMGGFVRMASADIPRPNRPPAPPINAVAPPQLDVTVVERNGEVVLRIPSRMLGQLNIKKANAPRSEIPTIMIGIALAAAITLGGMRLSGRGRRIGNRTLSVGLLACIALIVAGQVVANAPPPPRPLPPPAKPGTTASFPLVIEVVDTKDNAEMTIGAAQVAKLAPAPKPAEK